MEAILKKNGQMRIIIICMILVNIARAQPYGTIVIYKNPADIYKGGIRIDALHLAYYLAPDC